MRLAAPWPLPLIRALGCLLGALLYGLAVRRRHVVEVNLRLCFPQWTPSQRRRMVWRHFIAFGQSVLDRAWLWHGSVDQLVRRLRVVGNLQPLREPDGVVVFAPHFVGLDAGGLALTLLEQLPMSTIYVPQRNPVLDTWVRQGRGRAGHNKLYFRHEGVKQILTDLRHGGKLYLLPDMDFGPQESVFVPFFGVQAATLPSVSRFARLGRARVMTVVTRMTPDGYEVRVGPPWPDFPGGDVEADTARMNRALEDEIRQMPAQYYWVHKRFKTRPPGEPGVY